MWSELWGVALIWAAMVGYVAALSWSTGKKGPAAVLWGVAVGTGVLAVLAVFLTGAFLIHDN